MDPLSVGGGGELFGMKRLTNNQSWKILKNLCYLAASAEVLLLSI